MKYLWRYGSTSIPLLLFILVFLVLVLLFRLDVINLADLAKEENKNLIDSVSTITGTLILLVGATLSYIRFFKGRIFKPKADLEVRAGRFSSKYRNLYWLEIGIRNQGNITIFNYCVDIYVVSHPSSNRFRMSKWLISRSSKEKPNNRFGVSKWFISSRSKEKPKVIDVGETAFEHAVIELEKQAIAYTFEVEVTDNDGQTWNRCLTVYNHGSEC